MMRIIIHKVLVHREMEGRNIRASFLHEMLRSLGRFIGSRSKMAEGYPGRGLAGRPPPMRRAVVDSESCLGCGTCASICYYGRIRVKRGTARVLRGCQGCGACARECPEDAIAMVNS